MIIVWYHGEFTYRIFYWSPTCTKTSEFEQSVEVTTDAKSESGIVEIFHSMNISPGRDSYTVFTSFLVSLLVSGYYPVLTDACIHIFKNRPLEPACGSNSYWYRFYLIRCQCVYHFVFATPLRRSFDTTAYRGQCCWATHRGSYCFDVSAYRDAMTKNIKTDILHKSYEKNIKTIIKNERDCMRGNRDLVQISL